MAGGGIRGLLNSYVCFTAGHRVLVPTADGSGYGELPIEQIAERGGGEMGDGGGQHVLARDENDPDAPLVLPSLLQRIVRT